MLRLSTQHLMQPCIQTCALGGWCQACGVEERHERSSHKAATANFNWQTVYLPLLLRALGHKGGVLGFLALICFLHVFFPWNGEFPNDEDSGSVWPYDQVRAETCNGCCNWENKPARWVRFDLPVAASLQDLDSFLWPASFLVSATSFWHKKDVSVLVALSRFLVCNFCGLLHCLCYDRKNLVMPPSVHSLSQSSGAGAENVLQCTVPSHMPRLLELASFHWVRFEGVGRRSYAERRRKEIPCCSADHRSLHVSFFCSTPSHLVQAPCLLCPTALVRRLCS